MVDNLTKEQRKKCMSNIRSKNTKAEIVLRKRLWDKGYRYRIHYKLPGKPDVVFVKQKSVIFVDGCFWHKCPKCYKEPKSNKKYWIPKIEKNVARAKEINIELRRRGWQVLRIWEHNIKKNFDVALKRIISKIDHWT